MIHARERFKILRGLHTNEIHCDNFLSNKVSYYQRETIKKKKGWKMGWFYELDNLFIFKTNDAKKRRFPREPTRLFCK